MASQQNHFHEENRASWNEAVVAHNSHKVDQHLFFRNKGSTLFREEKDLLGDLSGLRVCHLQCNAGQDTLSLVTKLGAQNPIGVDISDNAIDFATQLSRDSGVEATFVRADVLEFFETTKPDQFDVVFVSYGAVNWLSSIQKWAVGVHKILKPGGRFCMVEFHPTSGMFNQDMIRDYPYSSDGVNMREQGGVSDYVARSFADSAEVQPDLKYTTGIQGFRNTSPCHEFCWGIADVVGSLAETGLHLKHLKEYPYSNFSKVFSTMKPELVEEGTRWRSEGPMLPLMYSVCFQKPLKA
ncbi:methyltransferase type 11 [Linnemannia elongata]|nr:methyltransferase type 11 [Linnemannia elongata]